MGARKDFPNVFAPSAWRLFQAVMDHGVVCSMIVA